MRRLLGGFEPGCDASPGSVTGQRLSDVSRIALGVRFAKVTALRLRRMTQWVVRPTRFPTLPVADGADAFPFVLYRRRIPIARSDAAADPILEEGKQINLALAAPYFDSVVLSSDRPISFWRCLGRVTTARGFRPGMELRGGCLVPAVGGGLCLLSNALFEMAVELGWVILERHGHTLEAIPPDTGIWGLDATVFWPYVDLRFAPRRGRVRLSMVVRDGVLELGADGNEPLREHVLLRERHCATRTIAGEPVRTNEVVRCVRDAAGREIESAVIAVNRKRILDPDAQRRTCLTCDETDCHARPRLLRIVS